MPRTPRRSAAGSGVVSCDEKLTTLTGKDTAAFLSDEATEGSRLCVYDGRVVSGRTRAEREAQ